MFPNFASIPMGIRPTQARFINRWSLALLTVALTASQGCKKDEAAAPPPPAAPAGAAAPAAPATSGTTNAAAASTNAPAGDTVDLRLKWPVGKRYVQRMEVVQESESMIPGVPQAMKQESVQSQDYSITVTKEREGGGRELELEFVGQKVDTKMGGKSLVTFDSKSDTKGDRTNAVASAMRKLVGVKIQYLTDTNGRIEKVVGGQELQNRLTSTATPQAKMILSSLLNDENLKRVVTLAVGLPDKPVKVGETWPVQRDTPLGQMGALQLDMTYTFKGWEEHEKRRCALLEFTGSVTNKAAAAVGTMSMTVENGKTSGKLWFDPVAGMVIDSYSDQEMTMKIVSGGQNIESKTKQKVGVKVVENADPPKNN